MRFRSRSFLLPDIFLTSGIFALDGRFESQDGLLDPKRQTVGLPVGCAAAVEVTVEATFVMVTVYRVFGSSKAHRDS